MAKDEQVQSHGGGALRPRPAPWRGTPPSPRSIPSAQAAASLGGFSSRCGVRVGGHRALGRAGRLGDPSRERGRPVARDPRSSARVTPHGRRGHAAQASVCRRRPSRERPQQSAATRGKTHRRTGGPPSPARRHVPHSHGWWYGQVQAGAEQGAHRPVSEGMANCTGD